MSSQDPISGRWYTGKPMYTSEDAERERVELIERMRREQSWWWRFLVWLRIR